MSYKVELEDDYMPVWYTLTDEVGGLRISFDVAAIVTAKLMLRGG